MNKKTDSKNNAMAADNKAENAMTQDEELDLDDLDQVAGGANPFGNIGRVESKKLDEKIRGKV